MFRLWAKIFKDTHLIADTVIEDNRMETRTHKVFDAIDAAVNEFNISRPIWLDSNINDFKKYAKVRFNKDNFIEEIDFDYLEIHIIEED